MKNSVVGEFLTLAGPMNLKLVDSKTTVLVL